MSHQIPYSTDTFRPVSDLIPGNETNENPVEFDLVPAEGADLARLKSIMFASAGLVNTSTWTPEMQEAVIRAFETGKAAFIQTIEAIRGLTIPAALAKRVGIIQELPTHVPEGTTSPVPNPKAPVPVLHGLSFAKICGFVPAMALHVAMKIVDLSGKAEAIDPRFFGQPSGSGGPGITGQMNGTAGNARQRSRRRRTAASQAPTDSQQPGT